MRRANAVIRFVVLVALPERREWAKAMQAEIKHLPDAAALQFALGCLMATLLARVVTSTFILQTARWTLILGAAAWSVLNIWLAGRLAASGAASPAMLAYVAATIFALGACFAAWWGLSATAVLATPVLTLVGIVAVAADALLPSSPNNKFYQAIAIEYSAILLVALLIAIGVPRWVETRERINQ
jgi:uncharacterized membrane protein